MKGPLISKMLFEQSALFEWLDFTIQFGDIRIRNSLFNDI